MRRGLDCNRIGPRRPQTRRSQCSDPQTLRLSDPPTKRSHRNLSELGASAGRQKLVCLPIELLPQVQVLLALRLRDEEPWRRAAKALFPKGQHLACTEGLGGDFLHELTRREVAHRHRELADMLPQHIDLKVRPGETRATGRRPAPVESAAKGARPCGTRRRPPRACQPLASVGRPFVSSCELVRLEASILADDGVYEVVGTGLLHQSCEEGAEGKGSRVRVGEGVEVVLMLIDRVKMVVELRPTGEGGDRERRRDL